jgi:hypothetical protein
MNTQTHEWDIYVYAAGEVAGDHRIEVATVGGTSIRQRLLIEPLVPLDRPYVLMLATSFGWVGQFSQFAKILAERDIQLVVAFRRSDGGLSSVLGSPSIPANVDTPDESIVLGNSLRLVLKRLESGNARLISNFSFGAQTDYFPSPLDGVRHVTLDSNRVPVGSIALFSTGTAFSIAPASLSMAELLAADDSQHAALGILATGFGIVSLSDICDLEPRFSELSNPVSVASLQIVAPEVDRTCSGTSRTAAASGLDREMVRILTDECDNWDLTTVQIPNSEMARGC